MTVTLARLVSALIDDVRANPAIAPSYQVVTDEREIWRRMVFCVLSSQSRSERVASITDALLNHVPFFISGSLGELRQFSAEVLTKSEHRFPSRHATQLAHAWFAFCQLRGSCFAYFSSFPTEQLARRAVVETFAGLGMKQASMFLRDIGLARDLAVIDVHILRYLADVHGIKVASMSASRYEALEKQLKTDAGRVGLPLSVFDPVVWTAVRTLKNYYYDA